MRPWIIVLSSAVVAAAAVIGVARSGLSTAPNPAIASNLTLLLPTLAVTALAVYALCVILLTSALLVGASLQLRRLLNRYPARLRSMQPDWMAAFEGSALRPLMPRPAMFQPRSAADGLVTLQDRFRPAEARRELARLHYIWAARTHFFSALILLTATAALGEAQRYTALPILPGPVPTIAAILAIVGLMLVAVLGRIAIDVTVEPLIETMTQLPVERPETALLRRAVESIETAGAARTVREADMSAAAPQISEQFISAFEEGYHALSDAIGRLSATTEGAAATTRSSIEALETTFRATELSERTAAQNTPTDTAELARLRDAVTALTSVLERVGGVSSTPTESDGSTGAPDLSSSDREPNIARELRRLLQEI